MTVEENVTLWGHYIVNTLEQSEICVSDHGLETIIMPIFTTFCVKFSFKISKYLFLSKIPSIKISFSIPAVKILPYIINPSQLCFRTTTFQDSFFKLCIDFSLH